MNRGDEVVTQIDALRFGVRLYVLVGVVFVVAGLFFTTGPWQWFAGSIGVVSLARAGWYQLKLRELVEANGPPSERPGQSGGGGK